MSKFFSFTEFWLIFVSRGVAARLLRWKSARLPASWSHDVHHGQSASLRDALPRLGHSQDWVSHTFIIQRPGGSLAESCSQSAHSSETPPLTLRAAKTPIRPVARHKWSCAHRTVLSGDFSAAGWWWWWWRWVDFTVTAHLNCPEHQLHACVNETIWLADTFRAFKIIFILYFILRHLRAVIRSKHRLSVLCLCLWSFSSCEVWAEPSYSGFMELKLCWFLAQRCNV